MRSRKSESINTHSEKVTIVLASPNSRPRPAPHGRGNELQESAKSCRFWVPKCSFQPWAADSCRSEPDLPSLILIPQRPLHEPSRSHRHEAMIEHYSK